MCLQLRAANDKSYYFYFKSDHFVQQIPQGPKNLKNWREISDSQSHTRQTHTFTTTHSKFCLFDVLIGVLLEIFLMAPTKIHVATVMRSFKGMKNG